jgi:N utilization substance protein B
MKRRKAREYLLQILYMSEGQGGSNSLEDNFFRHFLKESSRQNVDENFLKKQAQVILENLPTIDQYIEGASEHWKLGRMTRIDRNILRLAVGEFLYCNDIAKSVTIDEAVEIAKRFGSEESPAFVNGVLDMIYKKIPQNPEKVLH